MARPAPRGRWVALATALGTVLALLTASPARADDAPGGPMPDPATCVSPFECLYFITDESNTEPDEAPSNESWDLVAVNADPNPGTTPSPDAPPWQGTFLIRQHSTATAEHPQCMGTSDNQQTQDCDPAKDGQRWYLEPAGVVGGSVVTDPASPNAWSPFYSAFYLRSADDDHAGQCYGSAFNDLHADQNGHGNHGALKDCTDIDVPTRFRWRLSRTSPFGTPVQPTLTPTQQGEVANTVRGLALSHALTRCSLKPALCKAHLYDVNKRGFVSEWSRINELKVTSAPAPVLLNNSCAAGAVGDETGDSGAGAVRVLYNGGDASMSATLGASGSSEYSHSLTAGLSVAVEQSWDAVVASGSVTVTASVEYGQTWTNSRSVSQEVNWTVPPHRYATATLSTSALQLVAEWAFNDGLFNPWSTDRFTRLTVPYSADSGAGSPDSVLAVYNSWDRKACSASGPSRLDPQHILEIENLSSPGLAPTVGDTLGAVADASWWVPPAFSSAPVALRYQWYRQRGAEPAEAISNARLATYTVTEDDITDDEVMDRYGPYHIYVGVTDVSDQYRFDSAEYRSLTTSAVREARNPIEDTRLTLSLLNPDTDAGTDTIVDIAAAATGSPSSPSGAVLIRDNGEVLGDPVTLGPDGTARTRLRLPRGNHALEAVYDGDGTVSGARSNVVRTNVAGTPTRTTLEVDRESVGVLGGATTATVRVTPVGGSDVRPSGVVRLRADGRTLGAPVTLEADGTARISLPSAIAAGARQLTAGYQGDAVFDPSASEPVTQYVDRIGARVAVSSSARVTHRRGAVRLLAGVTAGSGGTPQGAVQFLVDGRAQGGRLALDGLGQTRLRVKGLSVGTHRITARYAPATAVHGTALSGTTLVEVRRHGVRTTIEPKRSLLGPRQRLVVRGTVRVIGPTKGRGPRIAGRKVQLLRDGQVIRSVKVRPDGHYRISVAAARLAKGANGIQVRYVGSRPASIAPGLSRTVVIHRR